MEDIKVISEITYYIVISSAAIVGGIFSLIQWNKQLKLRKAELLEKLMDSLLNEEDIVDTVYKIEYDQHWYKEESGKDLFHKTEFEKKVDKTFTRYSYFAYLCEKKLIKENEFDFVRYTIERILKNKQAQDYLHFLIDFSSKEKVFFPFSSLVNYGKKIGLFNK